jgi:hypothetical protein
VFIGTDLQSRTLRAALEQCFLDDTEQDLAPRAWRAEDLFPAWGEHCPAGDDDHDRTGPATTVKAALAPPR